MSTLISDSVRSYVFDRHATYGRGALGFAGAVLLLWFSVSMPPTARAQTTYALTTFHSFAGGSDGTDPEAGLALGGDGNFYGTTDFSGTNDNGTIFRVTSAGVLTTLYSLPSGNRIGSSSSGLTVGSDGNLYGTTENVSNSLDSIFQLTPAGALTTIHTLSVNDGEAAYGRLVQGIDGNLYGLTRYGGVNGSGTIFRITTAGVFSALYSFKASDVSNGSGSVTGFVQGSDGNFYGTTDGGTSTLGAVFRMTPAGVLTILHTFSGGSDGGYPLGGLVQGSDGNFYGTASLGGGNGNNGTIFRMTPAGVLTTLYAFSGGSDGASPSGALIQGSDGNFYGTTSNGGGTGNAGTIFRVTPAGGLTILYRFSGGSNGGAPHAGLIQAGDGSFYGTTSLGGTADDGTVFRLALADVPGAGTVSLAAASTTTTENAGSVRLAVNRAGGNTGPVSVAYSTADSSALDGRDYRAVSGTLSWADGDSGTKFITVPILDRGLSSGSTLFALNLSNPTGGAVLNSPVQEAVTILDTESTAGNLLSVSLLSPPTGVTVLQNTSVTLQAGVEVLSGTLDHVEFYATDSAGHSTDLGGTTNPRGQVTWVPTAAGSYTLSVVATDTKGNSRTATALVSVVAAASEPAPPQATLQGGLDGTTLALGDIVEVTAQAMDSDGNALSNVQFYLDGVPITTTTVPARIVVDRRKATASASTVSRADVSFSKSQQTLTVVGTNSRGVSAVSRAATLYGKVNAGTPPTTSISDLQDGDDVPAGSAGRSVTVAASPGSLPVDHVELFVDDMSVGTATTAPYVFKLPALKEGPHSVSAKSTDPSLLSKFSLPVVVKAVLTYVRPAFFNGEVALSAGVYYLAFPGGTPFGYYEYLSDPHFLYHFDLGFEYIFDLGNGGVVFYDFASSSYFYTSPTFAFPYLYDFNLQAFLYYYPDPTNPQRYNTNGVRYFFNFSTGKIISL